MSHWINVSVESLNLTNKSGKSYSSVKRLEFFFFYDFSILSVLRMQNLADIVVAYLMALFYLHRSESVESGGELVMNGYRYTAVLHARVWLL